MRLALLLVTPLYAWCQTTDIAASSDPFLFKRVPGFQITEYQDEAKGSAMFQARIEGHKTQITYRNTGAPISPESILQHYQRAALGLGGKLLNQTPQSATFMVRGKSTEMWLLLDVPGLNQYKLTIVEGGIASPEVTPDDLRATLEREGRLALPIIFKMDEAVVKPESEPLIAKAVQVLKSTSAPQISVEGHTDFVGNPETNRVLSIARAKAVADIFIAQGIDPNRLKIAGYGQDRPLGDNKSEEGRAKNRRIELVIPNFQPSAGASSVHPKDAAGAQDHPSFPRPPGYILTHADVQESTDVIFAVGRPGESKDVTVHGRRQELIYQFDTLSSKPMPGPEELLKIGGGDLQYASSSASVKKLGEVWARIAAASGDQYTVTIVTPQ